MLTTRFGCSPRRDAASAGPGGDENTNVRFEKAIHRAVAGRRCAWLVLAVTAALSFALIAWGAGPSTAAIGPDVPASAQAAQIARLQLSLPNANVTTALVVYSSGRNTHTAPDRTALSARAAALAHFARGARVAGPLFSSDGRVALVTVPLTATPDTAKIAERVAAIAAVAREGLPPGVLMHVSGPAGFQADLNNVFSGANTRLLLVTVMVVAVLLIITYRSPWLWLVPLVVIGVAEQVASVAATRLAAHVGIPIDAATTGILSVLVFGAGTDYALLFIARYRDELHKSEDRYAAMRRAWSGAAAAIAASGATVTLSLLVLLAAAIPSTRALGFACAVGIVVAVAFALLVLPPALVIFGRGLFWPRIPRAETAPTQNGRFWARLGAAVARHPGAVTIASVAILAIPALGLGGVHIGLTQTQQFRDQPPSVIGENILAQAFPAGESEPAAIISASSAAQHVAAVARSTPGVAGAYVGDTNGTMTEVDAVLRSAPGTQGAFSAVVALRAKVQAIPGANAVVGGPDAITLDSNQAWARDRLLIIPIVLAVILGVLILLLRALIAPLLLILTVAASYLAAFGAGQFVFTHVYGFSALDVGVPLLSFLFLAALGVDYNIFLVTRAREEASKLGTNAGMQRALAMTGGVITSAGILLASVFAVLGVLPLIALTQIGVIVGIGVLLDTLLVRTVLVPALAFLVGEHFWWPGRVVGRQQGSALHRSRPIEADVRSA
jgi:RND superfamily putative drug exporter